jgi:hypothetical protein
MAARAWERQPEDTMASFACFQLYLAQEPMDRSLRELATSTGTRQATVMDWSRAGGWVRRAQAYDDWVAAKRRAENEAKRSRALERIQDAANAGVQRYGAWLVNDMPNARLTGGEMVALFRASTDAYLKASGTAQVVQVQGPDGKPLTNDELPKVIARAVSRLAVEHPEALAVLLEEFQPRPEED